MWLRYERHAPGSRTFFRVDPHHGTQLRRAPRHPSRRPRARGILRGPPLDQRAARRVLDTVVPGSADLGSGWRFGEAGAEDGIRRVIGCWWLVSGNWPAPLKVGQGERAGRDAGLVVFPEAPIRRS